MDMQRGALSLVLAFALAGCTYSAPTDVLPAPARSSGPAAPLASSPATLESMPWVAEGTFQSQAAVTTGTAALRVTDSGATLELKDFATGNNEDLTIVFSPGTLSPTANGGLALTSPDMFVLARLERTRGTQQYEISGGQWAGMPPVGSVVIYDFAARTAYGAANLAQASRP